MMKNHMRPIHPGEILREDQLKPARMTANELADALHVPAAQIEAILREKRSITPNIALRLARYFGGDAQSWLNLQQVYDLKIAERELLPIIAEEIQPHADPEFFHQMRIAGQVMRDEDDVLRELSRR